MSFQAFVAKLQHRIAHGADVEVLKAADFSESGTSRRRSLLSSGGQNCGKHRLRRLVSAVRREWCRGRLHSQWGPGAMAA